jgi:hypothetical protein
VDIYTREPRGLRKVRRERAGHSGVIVHGWYNRVRGWSSAFGWNAVTVRIDGTERATLYQVKPGPLWIDLESGVHFVEFLGSGRLLHTDWLKLGTGEAVMIAFKPRERVPFRRTPTADQWCMRQLW